MTFVDSARPFLTLHLGQAGVQIGNAIWELLCLEHNIEKSGAAKTECPGNGFYDAMFLRSQSGHFMPRAIFLDTDPTCIDEIRSGPYRDLFNKQQLLSDVMDAQMNYMVGLKYFNKKLVPEAVERFRWLAEKSDFTPTTILTHSISGGTGSGLAVSFLNALKEELDTRIKVLDFSVIAGNSSLQSSSELINSALYTYESKDHTFLSFWASNSAMFRVCRSGLSMNGTATFAHINRMLAMCFSNLTAMDRFHGTLACNIASLCTNMLPFRQLKHTVLACAPFVSTSNVGKERLSASGISAAVLEPDNQLVDLDLRQGKQMAGVLIFRGAAKPVDVDQALNSVRERGRIEFAEWAPANFKAGLINLPPLAPPNSGIAETPLSVTLVSNSTVTSTLFRSQSEAMRKLLAVNLFLHNYTIEKNNTFKALHLNDNQNADGSTELMKEACDYLDELADTYANLHPPTDQSTGHKTSKKKGATDQSKSKCASDPSKPKKKPCLTQSKCADKSPKKSSKSDGKSPKSDGKSPKSNGESPNITPKSDGKSPKSNGESPNITPKSNAKKDAKKRNASQESGESKKMCSRSPKNVQKSDGKSPKKEKKSDGKSPKKEKKSDGKSPKKESKEKGKKGAKKRNTSNTSEESRITPQNYNQSPFRSGKVKKNSCRCCNKRPNEQRNQSFGNKIRSQSQNHANSWGARTSYHLVYSKGTGSQDDILVGTRDSHCYGSHLSSFGGAMNQSDWLAKEHGGASKLDIESLSSAGSDSTMDLEDLIQYCQPGLMPDIINIKKISKDNNELLINEPL